MQQTKLDPVIRMRVPLHRTGATVKIPISLSPEVYSPDFTRHLGKINGDDEVQPVCYLIAMEQPASQSLRRNCLPGAPRQRE
jgi:hypothetical protein